jgi:DNA repair protein RadD
MEETGTPRRVLRDYQTRAVRRVREEWGSHRAVCLVAPTGSGKTTMGVALAFDHDRVVWVAHRRELVKQAMERLEGEGLRVGAICPGLEADASAPVQVGTIQTLLAGGHAPPADLLVLDEAHHYAKAAKHWNSFQDAYQDTRMLGLTATPQRSDGSPLGDVFGGIVEAATYSELIKAEHLVDCHVYRSPANKVEKGWATTPLEAYQADGDGGQGFAFYDRVDRAHEWSDKFDDAGIASAVISGKTKPADRTDIMDRFQEGDLRVLHNVYTLTEGVDVPAASVAIMARCPQHVSQYIQMVGRVLRPHESKPHARLLDISGASHLHGFPTEDRVYTLDGKGIIPAEKSTTRKCLECGHVYARSMDSCPMCGTAAPKQGPPTIRIYSETLRRVYAGADTPDDSKRREYLRLRGLALRKGYRIGWVLWHYGKLFPDERPDTGDVTPDEWKEEHMHLSKIAREKGYKKGWVGHKFKAMSGRWPPRQWDWEVRS